MVPRLRADGKHSSLQAEGQHSPLRAEGRYSPLRVEGQTAHRDETTGRSSRWHKPGTRSLWGAAMQPVADTYVPEDSRPRRRSLYMRLGNPTRGA
jgi:hypothetical protein